jgi:hypothetical protein
MHHGCTECVHEGVGINWGGVIGVVVGAHRNLDGAVPVFPIWVRLVVKTNFLVASGGRCTG